MNRTHEYPHHPAPPTPKPDKTAQISRLLASVRSLDDHISERLALADSYESSVVQDKPQQTSREDRRRLRLVHVELNSLYRNRRQLLRALATAGLRKNRWTENRGVLIHLATVETDGLEEYAIVTLPRRAGRYILEREPTGVSRRRVRYAADLNGAALQAFATLGVLLAIALLANPLSEHPVVLLMAVAGTIIALTFFTEGTRYVIRRCGPNPPKPPFEQIPPHSPASTLSDPPSAAEPVTGRLPRPSVGNDADNAPAAADPAPIDNPVEKNGAAVARPQYFQQTLDLFIPSDGGGTNEPAEPQRQKS